MFTDVLHAAHQCVIRKSNTQLGDKTSGGSTVALSLPSWLLLPPRTPLSMSAPDYRTSGSVSVLFFHIPQELSHNYSVFYSYMRTFELYFILAVYNFGYFIIWIVLAYVSCPSTLKWWRLSPRWRGVRRSYETVESFFLQYFLLLVATILPIIFITITIIIFTHLIIFIYSKC